MNNAIQKQPTTKLHKWTEVQGRTAQGGDTRTTTNTTSVNGGEAMLVDRERRHDDDSGSITRIDYGPASETPGRTTIQSREWGSGLKDSFVQSVELDREKHQCRGGEKGPDGGRQFGEKECFEKFEQLMSAWEDSFQEAQVTNRIEHERHE